MSENDFLGKGVAFPFRFGDAGGAAGCVLHGEARADLRVDDRVVRDVVKPDWREIAAGVCWCRGCGCLKIQRPGLKALYLVPRREKERRERKGSAG